MYVLKAEVYIGKYLFRDVYEIEITKSIENLSDTAIIKLPNRFTVKNQNNKVKMTEEAINPGDNVVIKLGYEDEYFDVEFLGTVSKVSPKVPLEIHCEDDIRLLRKKNIKKAWNKKVSLKEVLAEIVKGTPVELAPNIQDTTFDKMIFDNLNGAQALQKLKDDYFLSIYMNNDRELYAGLQQLNNIGQTVIYDLNYNLVENNLEFRTKEDRKIKVRYTYISKSNEKTTVEEGDKDGELRTYNTSILSDKAKLKEMAKEKLNELKYDGYDGDVTSFLIPFVTRGMAAQFYDQEHPNREGKYFIKSVTTSFSTSGARRKIKIGNRL